MDRGPDEVAEPVGVGGLHTLHRNTEGGLVRLAREGRGWSSG